MLKLRRGIGRRGRIRCTVRVGGEERPAWADDALVGEVREGDEVIVNTEARDLGLGSGGLRRRPRQPDPGPARRRGAGEATALKLNYTSLQHPVEPVEAREDDGGRTPAFPSWCSRSTASSRRPRGRPRRASAGLRVGYVQTSGGALPGSLSRGRRRAARARAALRARHRGPATAASSRRSRVIGALQAAAGHSAGTRSIAGPGPGIVGSAIGAGPRRDGGPGHGARLADPRPADAARAADVERRPATAPPRPQPPHRDGAADAARQRAGAGAGARADALATASARGRRDRSTSCARPAATATRSGRARRPVDELRGERPARRRTWAASSPTTLSSSPPRSPRETRWPARSRSGRRERRSASEAGGKLVHRGPIASVRMETFQLRGRQQVDQRRSSVTRAPSA